MLNFFKKDRDKVINVNDLDDLYGKIELIDIREPYEFKAINLKNFKNIPIDTILKDPSKYLKKEKNIILFANLEYEVELHARY